MATQTAPLNSVEDLNQQLGHLWKTRRDLEKELALVTLGIQTADQNARPLKKRLGQGDRGASSLLDKIDADRKELVRKEEGLRLALEELEPKINAAQQEITAARRVQDEQEQEQRFREACDKAAALVEREPQLKAAIDVVSKTREYFRIAQKAGYRVPKAKFDQLKASHDGAMDLIVRSLAASGNTAGAIELIRERPRFAMPGN